MNKNKILSTLIENLNTELDKAKEAYETAKLMTQDPEAKAESKWDTRSIEAGYLAGAQKKRVDELEMDVKMIEELASEKHTKKKTVAIGSLVDIKFNDNTRKYFIAPTAGGTMINVDGEIALVISVFSPIGNGVLDLEAGDTFEVEMKDGNREYEIISFE
jgi:transcription elongation GreA/GreB family factor